MMSFCHRYRPASSFSTATTINWVYRSRPQCADGSGCPMETAALTEPLLFDLRHRTGQPRRQDGRPVCIIGKDYVLKLTEVLHCTFQRD